MRDDMNGRELDREIERALAVDPSPEFAARVRLRIASEPAPGLWRSAFALRSQPLWALCFAGGAVTALAIAVGVIISRPAPSARLKGSPYTSSTNVARGFQPGGGLQPSDAPTKPETPTRVEGSPDTRATNVARGFQPSGGFQPSDRARESETLLDARETRALQRLIAGVRDGRVDLSPVLDAKAVDAMDLPPVKDLVIVPLTIEPLVPQSGTEGARP